MGKLEEAGFSYVMFDYHTTPVEFEIGGDSLQIWNTTRADDFIVHSRADIGLSNITCKTQRMMLQVVPYNGCNHGFLKVLVRIYTSGSQGLVISIRVIYF